MVNMAHMRHLVLAIRLADYRVGFASFISVFKQKAHPLIDTFKLVFVL